MNFAELNNVHIPAAMLKSFLRQLPEPLLTYDLYDHIIHVQCVCLMLFLCCILFMLWTCCSWQWSLTVVTAVIVQFTDCKYKIFINTEWWRYKCSMISCLLTDPVLWRPNFKNMLHHNCKPLWLHLPVCCSFHQGRRNTKDMPDCIVLWILVRQWEFQCVCK